MPSEASYTQTDTDRYYTNTLYSRYTPLMYNEKRADALKGMLYLYNVLE